MMKQISSRATFLTKRVFPTAWFGFLAVIVITGIIGGSFGANMPMPFFIVPVVMAVFGYFLMKKLVFDLVDEVWDAGSDLLIKNGGREARIALADIINVSYSVATNPQRVTLTLRQPSAFGKEVSFAAPTAWVPFAKSPIIDDLIQRVDAARRLEP